MRASLCLLFAVALALVSAPLAQANQRIFIDSFNDGSVVQGRVDSDGDIDELAPFTTGAAGNEGVAASPNGKTLLIAGAGGSAFSFSVSKNGVKPRGHVDYAGSSAYGAVFSPNGRYAFVATSKLGGGDIRGYRVASNGKLKPNGKKSMGDTPPTGVAITPSGKYLYVATTGNDLKIFKVSSKGKLKEAGNSPLTTGPNTFALSISSDGRHLYTADNNTPSFVHAFKIGKHGALAELGSSPYPVSGDGPFGSTISPDGRFLYIANYTSSTISGFKIARSGALTPLPGVAYPGPDSTAALAITASGSRLFAVNGDGGGLGVYDLVDGEPMNMLNSLFSNQGDFQSIVLTPAQPPTARLKAPKDGDAGRPVEFNAKASRDDGDIVQFTWSFGDGKKTVTMGSDVAHKYAKPGTYKVKVTATDEDGCSTKLVTTGQTAYCNGSKRATASAKITVRK